jgi:hypothetical protein
MRFAVDEALRGVSASEITIETGSGGGDCGTPLPPGGRFLIFASKSNDGKLWTGLCSGNQRLTGGPSYESILAEYRALAKSGTGTIFGRIVHSKPVWEDDAIDEGVFKPMAGTTVRATSDKFSGVTTTGKDGSYEFPGLSEGKYTVVPEGTKGFDFDHEYPENYEAEVDNGACASINFRMMPSTRIRGRVTFPAGSEAKTIEVVAIPTHLKELNQFSGKWDFTDENARFDLWPLPPGDYFVGVNINSSPKADSPFPPTYYPGLTRKESASVVHVEEGDIKEVELALPEIAQPRSVSVLAIGPDGKPMRTLYVQLEDLRHPGDAASYQNIDLDPNGSGTINVYAGYSYHLHASHWEGYREDWCFEPVIIQAGTLPTEVRFLFAHKSDNCDLVEMDRSRKSKRP